MGGFIQGPIYKWAKNQKKPFRRTEVALALGISSSSASHALRRMAQGGWLIRTGNTHTSMYTVVRKEMPEDGRGQQPGSHRSLQASHREHWHERLVKAQEARQRPAPPKVKKPIPKTALEQAWGWLAQRNPEG